MLVGLTTALRSAAIDGGGGGISGGGGSSSRGSGDAATAVPGDNVGIAAEFSVPGIEPAGKSTIVGGGGGGAKRGKPALGRGVAAGDAAAAGAGGGGGLGAAVAACRVACFGIQIQISHSARKGMYLQNDFKHTLHHHMLQ